MITRPWEAGPTDEWRPARLLLQWGGDGGDGDGGDGDGWGGEGTGEGFGGAGQGFGGGYGGGPGSGGTGDSGFFGGQTGGYEGFSGYGGRGADAFGGTAGTAGFEGGPGGTEGPGYGAGTQGSGFGQQGSQQGGTAGFEGGLGGTEGPGYGAGLGGQGFGEQGENAAAFGGFGDPTAGSYAEGPSAAAYGGFGDPAGFGGFGDPTGGAAAADPTGGPAAYGGFGDPQGGRSAEGPSEAPGGFQTGISAIDALSAPSLSDMISGVAPGGFLSAVGPAAWEGLTGGLSSLGFTGWEGPSAVGGRSGGPSGPGAGLGYGMGPAGWQGFSAFGGFTSEDPGPAPGRGGPSEDPTTMGREAPMGRSEHYGKSEWETTPMNIEEMFGPKDPIDIDLLAPGRGVNPWGQPGRGPMSAPPNIHDPFMERDPGRMEPNWMTGRQAALESLDPLSTRDPGRALDIFGRTAPETRGPQTAQFDLGSRGLGPYGPNPLGPANFGPSAMPGAINQDVDLAAAMAASRAGRSGSMEDPGAMPGRAGLTQGMLDPTTMGFRGFEEDNRSISTLDPASRDALADAMARDAAYQARSQERGFDPYDPGPNPARGMTEQVHEAWAARDPSYNTLSPSGRGYAAPGAPSLSTAAIETAARGMSPDDIAAAIAANQQAIANLTAEEARGVVSPAEIAAALAAQQAAAARGVTGVSGITGQRGAEMTARGAFDVFGPTFGPYDVMGEIRGHANPEAVTAPGLADPTGKSDRGMAHANPLGAMSEQAVGKGDLSIAAPGGIAAARGHANPEAITVDPGLVADPFGPSHVNPLAQYGINAVPGYVADREAEAARSHVNPMSFGLFAGANPADVGRGAENLGLNPLGLTAPAPSAPLSEEAKAALTQALYGLTPQAFETPDPGRAGRNEFANPAAARGSPQSFNPEGRGPFGGRTSPAAVTVSPGQRGPAPGGPAPGRGGGRGGPAPGGRSGPAGAPSRDPFENRGPGGLNAPFGITSLPGLQDLSPSQIAALEAYLAAQQQAQSPVGAPSLFSMMG